MNTLTRDPGQPPMAKYPSLTSVHSMASIGFLPPGHGYVPKKEKPEKPYGLAFVTVMNRTHRGPGKKYLHYALASGIFALLLFGGAALYFGHRNVSRMVVYRTEVLGALMIIGGILFVAIMGEYLYKARVESNRWRMGIRVGIGATNSNMQSIKNKITYKDGMESQWQQDKTTKS